MIPIQGPGFGAARRRKGGQIERRRLYLSIAAASSLSAEKQEINFHDIPARSVARIQN